MADQSTIAKLPFEDGIVDAEQIRYARRVQAKLATPRPLADVLRELFRIDAETIHALIRKRRTEIRLGDLLVELGHLGAQDLETALAPEDEDPAAKKRLGEILVDHFVDESTLVDVLSLALGVPREEPNAAKLRKERLSRFPIRWCQEHDFVPLRVVEAGVVVAFYEQTSKGSLRAAGEI